MILCINFLLLDIVSGDARLAKSLKNKVFSFDLVSSDPSVITCDMSNVCRLFWLFLMSSFVSNDPYFCFN